MDRTIDMAGPNRVDSPQGRPTESPYRTPVHGSALDDAGESLGGSAMADEVVLGLLLVIPVVAGLLAHRFGSVETGFALSAVLVWMEVVRKSVAARHRAG